MTVAKLLFCVTSLLHVVWCHPRATHHGNLGIIGGHRIRIQKAPFMAALMVNGTRYRCGGSILHNRFILTAAHCIEPTLQYKVAVGIDEIRAGDELYDIEEIKVHNKYVKKTRDYDFCLIKLKAPLIFGLNVSKVKLPENDPALSVKTTLKTTGWHFYNKTTGPIYLMQAGVPFYKYKKCLQDYYDGKNRILTERMLCAGKRGIASCQDEDSGGPLTLKSGDDDVLVGVTSFELHCALLPTVYAKVSSVLSWINTEIR